MPFEMTVAVGILQSELVKCMDELHVLEAKHKRGNGMNGSRQNSTVSYAGAGQIERWPQTKSSANRGNNDMQQSMSRASRRTSLGRVEDDEREDDSQRVGKSPSTKTGKFSTYSAHFHRAVEERWGAKTNDQIRELILNKMGSFTEGGGFDPDLQPMVQEYIDRLLRDSQDIAENLQRVPMSPEEADLLQLSSCIVTEYVRVRSLREHIRDEIKAFVVVFESSAIQTPPQAVIPPGVESQEGAFFFQFMTYLPLISQARPDYRGHNPSAARMLRSLALNIVRHFLILGTHVVQLSGSVREYGGLKEIIDSQI